MSRADTTRKTATDVPYRPVGTGHTISGKCIARKGYFLCDAPVASRGICRECSEARAARAGRVAA